MPTVSIIAAGVWGAARQEGEGDEHEGAAEHGQQGLVGLPLPDDVLLDELGGPVGQRPALGGDVPGPPVVLLQQQRGEPRDRHHHRHRRHHDPTDRQPSAAMERDGEVRALGHDHDPRVVVSGERQRRGQSPEQQVDPRRRLHRLHESEQRHR
jgi:hypothetical protein